MMLENMNRIKLIIIAILLAVPMALAAQDDALTHCEFSSENCFSWNRESVCYDGHVSVAASNDQNLVVVHFGISV